MIHLNGSTLPVLAALAVCAPLLIACDSAGDSLLTIHVRGTVTEQSSGSPIDSVEVTLMYWNFNSPLLAMTMTGADGAYTLQTSVSREQCADDGLFLTFARIYEGGPALIELIDVECDQSRQVIDVALAEQEIIWKSG